jgi:transcriptional regulator with XRE-family HTH domain
MQAFSYKITEPQYNLVMPIGIGRPAKHRRTNFGDRLATAREEAGLTQSQLAHKLGTTQRVITYWERGTVALRADQLRALADLLDVSADYLLGKESSKPHNSGPVGKMRQLFEAASRLPRSQQQKIAAVLEAFVNQHSNGQKAA